MLHRPFSRLQAICCKQRVRIVLPPDGEQKVTALVTPSEKAIAGDYMVNFTVSGDGTSESVKYRITVLTSTLWGVAGLAVIRRWRGPWARSPD